MFVAFEPSGLLRVVPLGVSVSPQSPSPCFSHLHPRGPEKTGKPDRSAARRSLTWLRGGLPTPPRASSSSAAPLPRDLRWASLLCKRPHWVPELRLASNLD